MTERRTSNTWLVAVLAVAVGFFAAWLIFGDDDNTATVTDTDTVATAEAEATDTATAPETVTTPQNPGASVPACIDLWNRANNRGAQTALANLAARQPVRVHVGQTTDVPPECLVTVVANDGDAYTFPEGGGTTFPYAPAPGTADSSELPAESRTSNVLDQGDGTLRER